MDSAILLVPQEQLFLERTVLPQERVQEGRLFSARAIRLVPREQLFLERPAERQEPVQDK